MGIGKFDRGDLNVNVRPRTGYALEPERYSHHHYQSQLFNSFIKPKNIFLQADRLKAVVLAQLDPIEINGEMRVRIKARVPEIHPFPDPSVYGETIPEGVLALYPIFIGINSDITTTPGVGAQIYVDFGNRLNMEDPRYYGEVSKKPVSNGIMITKAVSKAKDSFNKIEDEFEGFLNHFGLITEDNNEDKDNKLLTKTPSLVPVRIAQAEIGTHSEGRFV